MNRGVGKRRIFESDSDRSYFAQKMSSYACTCEIKIIAWVLMDNHFHLLAEAPLEDLVSFMRRLSTSYAQHFNASHGHVGRVFQGRYSSIAVEDDNQLLATIRYIHLNPLDLGIANPEGYKWSSYSQYLGNAGVCTLDEIRSLLGGTESIKRLHEATCADEIVSLNEYRPRLSDAEAASLIRARLGEEFLDSLILLPKKDRDYALLRIYRLGISVPQIVRFTGFGENIVKKACYQKRSASQATHNAELFGTS